MGSSDQRCGSDVDWHALVRGVLENYCGITLLHVVLLLCFALIPTHSGLLPLCFLTSVHLGHLFLGSSLQVWICQSGTFQNNISMYFGGILYSSQVMPSCNVWIMEYLYNICFSAISLFVPMFSEEVDFWTATLLFCTSDLSSLVRHKRSGIHSEEKQPSFACWALVTTLLLLFWHPSLL